MHQTIATCSIFLILLLGTKVEGQSGTMVGTRTEIKNVRINKEVQALGRFSIEEHNRLILQMAPSPAHRDADGPGGSSLGDGPLVFVEVLEAQKQVVDGIKYYLKIEAMRGGFTRDYDAVVIVRPWLHSKQLLTFEPSLAPSPNN